MDDGRWMIDDGRWSSIVYRPSSKRQQTLDRALQAVHQRIAQRVVTLLGAADFVLFR